MTAVVPARGARPVEAHAEAAPSRRSGPHLRPVERPRPRRSPLVPALVAVGIVIAALLGLAAMHAVLIGGQVRLDAMRSDVTSETEAIRRLELRVAELESPDRVLDVARDRLGMLQPAEVGYLLPVSVEGAPQEPVRVEAATAPAITPTEAEVDAGVGDTEDVDGPATDSEADTGAESEGRAADDELPEGGRKE